MSSVKGFISRADLSSPQTEAVLAIPPGLSPSPGALMLPKAWLTEPQRLLFRSVFLPPRRPHREAGAALYHPSGF